MRQDERTAILSRSFGAVAEEYDRLRAGPPPEALAWMIPEGTADALEIGAGTGTLTRLLIPRVAAVLAVEPDARMRCVLRSLGADVAVVGARAEELPVATASIDLVIAQSAWHWVDESVAIPEVARALRPGGRFSLAWTGVDRSVDWVRDLWAGGVTHQEDSHIDVDADRQVRHLVSVDARPIGAAFTEPESAVFRWNREIGKADLVALASTYSTVITMEDDVRARHLRAMSSQLDSLEAFAGHEQVVIPMRSYCWGARRL